MQTVAGSSPAARSETNADEEFHVVRFYGYPAGYQPNGGALFIPLVVSSGEVNRDHCGLQNRIE